jgi:phosphoglycerate kinase
MVLLGCVSPTLVLRLTLPPSVLPFFFLQVSTKITVIETLINKVDKIVIGGGMVFTFLKARGHNVSLLPPSLPPSIVPLSSLPPFSPFHPPAHHHTHHPSLPLSPPSSLQVGGSLVEEDKLDLARELETLAAKKGVKFILPTDVVIADKFAPDANSKVVASTAIPEGWMGLDNGPDSTKMIQAELADCKTIIWNGPMGVFEFDKFAAGTSAIAQTMAELTAKGATTIVGGGDSVAAVEKAGLADKLSHVSTGGGASLELLEGKVLPGVAALNEA